MNKGILSAFQAEKPFPSSGFSNLVILTASTPVRFPSWVKKAKITVVGSGASSGTSTGQPGSAGCGGGTAISILNVNSSTLYTATVAPIAIHTGAAGSNTAPTPGSASSFTGQGIVSVTALGATASAPGTGFSGDLKIPGGGVGTVSTTSGAPGGSSFLCGVTPQNSPALGYGGGAGSPGANAAGLDSFSGVIMIEF